MKVTPAPTIAAAALRAGAIGDDHHEERQREPRRLRPQPDGEPGEERRQHHEPTAGGELLGRHLAIAPAALAGEGDGEDRLDFERQGQAGQRRSAAGWR